MAQSKKRARSFESDNSDCISPKKSAVPAEEQVTPRRGILRSLGRRLLLSAGRMSSSSTTLRPTPAASISDTSSSLKNSK